MIRAFALSAAALLGWPRNAMNMGVPSCRWFQRQAREIAGDGAARALLLREKALGSRRAAWDLRRL